MPNTPPTPPAAVVVEYQTSHALVFDQLKRPEFQVTIEQSEESARHVDAIERLEKAMDESASPMFLTYTGA